MSTTMLSVMRPNFLLLVTIVATAAAAAQGNEPRKAIAVVTGPTVRGNITFIQQGKRVMIMGRVTGLTKGYHGFHIHEKGDLSNGCTSTGSHFNPDTKKHGSPSDKDRHIGDLGNILADDQGVAVVNITDELISLLGSKRNILGRAVVIHADPDDLGRGGENDSMTTGHAGSRVACGVVGILSNGGQGSLFSASILSFVLATALTLLNNFL